MTQKKINSLPASYDRDVAALFSPSVISELAHCGRSSRVSHLMGAFQEKHRSYASFFEFCYTRLVTNYQSEYIYKNALVNQLFFGRKPQNNSIFFSEFRADDCKADVVIINGTSFAYEIKTKLDNTDRLARQLSAYNSIFDFVYVMTHETLVDKYKFMINSSTGIIALNNGRFLREIRPAISNKNTVIPGVVFTSLRRTEYCNIIMDSCGSVPNLPNTLIHSACMNIFCDFEPIYAHDSMVKALHKRKTPVNKMTQVKKVPACLRAAVLSSRLSESDIARLTTVLFSAPI